MAQEMNHQLTCRASCASQRGLAELETLAGPLLENEAFRRLAQITFLGVLSPRFAFQILSPLWSSTSCVVATTDGTRSDHSLGVALAAIELAQRLGLSSEAAKYAAVWGLTHDIASWPLSHTSEAAFRSITQLPTQAVREAMILGSDLLPPHLRIDRVLRLIGIEPQTLLSLFKKDPQLSNADLVLLNQVLQSPLTPDTLEGAWRAGMVFGIDVPSPSTMLSIFKRNCVAVHLEPSRHPLVLEFWNKKADTYHRFINRPDVVLWESAWSLGIKRLCKGWSLGQSMEVTEDSLISGVLSAGLPKCSHVIRYKKPQEYMVDELALLASDMPVNDLWRHLRRVPMEVFSNA